MNETIHSDFETIEREDQNYRISTRVEYRPTTEDYICKARLYKSYGGRVHNTRRDRLYRSTSVTSDKDNIERVLSECIENCREKLDEVEDAKDVSIDVSISDGDI